MSTLERIFKRIVIAGLSLLVLASCGSSRYAPANEYGFTPVTDGLEIQEIVRTEYPQYYERYMRHELVVRSCIVYYDSEGNARTHIELSQAPVKRGRS